MKHLILLSLFLLSSCNLIKIISGKDPKLDEEFLNRGLNIHVYTKDFYGNRSYFLTDEVEARTVYFEFYGASKLECSEDNGLTWIDCSGGSFVWKVENLYNYHRVRLSKDDQVYENGFIPSDYFRYGLNLISCNQTISANESIAEFNSRIIAQNDVICINDGIQIGSDTDTDTLTIGVNGVILFAKPNSGVSIKSSSIPVIDISGLNDIVFVGLNIEGQELGQTGIQNITTSTTYLTIEASNINVIGESSYGLNLTQNGGSVFLRDTSISAPSYTGSYGLYLVNSNVDIRNSFISSGYQSIYFENNFDSSTNGILTFYMDNSSVEIAADLNNSTNPGGINLMSNVVTANSNISINNSQVRSLSGGPAIQVINGPGNNQINLYSTKIIRGPNVSQDSPAIYFEFDQIGDSISFDFNSLICNEVSTTGALFDLIVEAPNADVVFDVTQMSAHTNNTDIGLCSN